MWTTGELCAIIVSDFLKAGDENWSDKGEEGDNKGNLVRRFSPSPLSFLSSCLYSYCYRSGAEPVPDRAPLLTSRPQFATFLTLKIPSEGGTHNGTTHLHL